MWDSSVSLYGIKTNLRLLKWAESYFDMFERGFGGDLWQSHSITISCVQFCVHFILMNDVAGGLACRPGKRDLMLSNSENFNYPTKGDFVVKFSLSLSLPLSLSKGNWPWKSNRDAIERNRIKNTYPWQFFTSFLIVFVKNQCSKITKIWWCVLPFRTKWCHEQGQNVWQKYPIRIIPHEPTFLFFFVVGVLVLSW